MGTIQIRNVPEDVYQIYKARAAAAGQSLQQYMLEWIERLVARLEVEERLEQIDPEAMWLGNRDEDELLGAGEDPVHAALDGGGPGTDRRQ